MRTAQGMLDASVRGAKQCCLSKKGMFHQQLC